MTWARFAVVVLAAVIGTGGCHAGGASKLGAGDPVDLCDGIVVLNALPEPDITDRQAVLDYVAGALRVLDRIDTDRSVHTLSDTKVSLPVSVVTALSNEVKAYQSLRAEVDAATSPAKLHDAVQGFTTSAGFAGADSTVELWTGNECG